MANNRIHLTFSTTAGDLYLGQSPLREGKPPGAIGAGALYLGSGGGRRCSVRWGCPGRQA